jgi:hypothetical protein
LWFQGFFLSLKGLWLQRVYEGTTLEVLVLPQM